MLNPSPAFILSFYALTTTCIARWSPAFCILGPPEKPNLPSSFYTFCTAGLHAAIAPCITSPLFFLLPILVFCSWQWQPKLKIEGWLLAAANSSSRYLHVIVTHLEKRRCWGLFAMRNVLFPCNCFHIILLQYYINCISTICARL